MGLRFGGGEEGSFKGLMALKQDGSVKALARKGLVINRITRAGVLAGKKLGSPAPWSSHISPPQCHQAPAVLSLTGRSKVWERGTYW